MMKTRLSPITRAGLALTAALSLAGAAQAAPELPAELPPFGKDKPLVVVDGSSLAGTPAGYVVRRMYTPPKSQAEMLEGSAEEVAAAIAKIIREKR